jgi:hypothetical protein
LASALLGNLLTEISSSFSTCIDSTLKNIYFFPFSFLFFNDDK